MARCGEPVVISLAEFTACAMSRSAARFGIRQLVRLGFVQLTAGSRRVNTFSRCDGWRVHDVDAAKQLVTLARGPMPRASISKPTSGQNTPKPVQVPKPATVEPPRRMRAVPSLPHLRCLAGDSA